MTPSPSLSLLARKVLLIGWDAADWRVIDPLLAQGKMPNLAEFLANGVRGNVSTLYPPLSPMLWTSIATGKRPPKHGIFGFTEPTADGRGVRPVTNLARKTKAVWNILQQAGRKSNVVGWWPSHPAEPISGVMVSNHYQRAGAKLGEKWPLMPGTVHPHRLIKPLAELRLHPQELDATHIAPFVPRWEEVNQEQDHRLETVAKLIAEVTSIHAAATALMQLEPWDFMAVYYDGIDHFEHAFMRYHPPRREWIDERDFELYSGVVEGAYRYHDMMLGALLALAGDETAVILMSDHGFHPDEHRVRAVPVEPAGPAAEHRHYGILAMKGPGIRRNERIYASSVLDVCPTVLRLFGLPAGADMDGKVLATAFEEMPKLAAIPSWDRVEGESGCHPAGSELDPVASAETMKQLVDLGYIEPLPKDREEAVRQTVRELRYNRAESYMDGLRYAEAAAIFEELWESWPQEHRFGFQLIECLATLGKPKPRREALEKLRSRMQTAAVEAEEALKKYRTAGGVWSVNDLPETERYEVRRLAALAAPNYDRLAYQISVQELMEGRPRQSLDTLRQLSAKQDLPAALECRLGLGLLKLGRPAEAEACFLAALQQEQEDVGALMGLALARDAMDQPERTLEAALQTVQLIFFNPRAHALVGRALVKLEQYDEAEQAFELALHQNPAQRDALRGLLRLHREQRPDAAKLAAVRQRIEERKTQARTRARKASERAAVRWIRSAQPRPQPDKPAAAPERTVTIVSGLPRSGTSMMMQMLVAGGVEAYSDGQRAADADNPRGYFEHDQAARLASHSGWIPRVRGKAVKVVAPLLPRLPDNESYAVILMSRDLAEIVASQREMLRRLGRSGAALEDEQLQSALLQQMETVERWIAVRPNVRALTLDYRDVLAEPARACRRIEEFLGRPLLRDAMERAVDPALRRQRQGEELPATDLPR
jgi:predicted AlkP superfamily phosphohydrolase/phosphomutase/tetratricopeptide (TPR) repeat protein